MGDDNCDCPEKTFFLLTSDINSNASASLPFRFATFDDCAWFEKTTKRVVEEDLGERLVHSVTQNQLFVDFLR
jgi:hypothetical protein